MTIPDKAVEAAARSNFQQINGHLWENQPEPSRDAWRRYARRTLETAAPFIAAQALRDYARTLGDDTLVDAHMIHETADEVDQ